MSACQPPSISLPPRLSPVGAVVQNFSMCFFTFLCCMENSALIMKHRERQRGCCSAPQIFKDPLWPWQCRGSKKYFIISVIYLSRRPNQTTDWISDWASGRSFCLLTCLTENPYSFSSVYLMKYTSLYWPACLPCEIFEAQCKKTQQWLKKKKPK